MKRYQTPLLIVVMTIGVLASLTIFYVIGDIERRNFQINFAADTNQRAIVIDWQIKSHLSTLIFFQHLFDANEQVTGDEFDIFARATFNDYPAIKAFAWASRVERGALEEVGSTDPLQIVGKGLSGYEEQSGVALSMSQGLVHYPITYVVNQQDIQKQLLELLDFDLASNQAFILALKKSRVSGVPVLVDNYRLGSDVIDHQGVLMLMPVYTKGDTKKLRGVVMGLLQVADIADNVLQEMALLPAKFQLLDVTHPDATEVLYSSNIDIDAQFSEDFLYRRKLQLLGEHQLLVEALPTQAYVSSRSSYLAYTCLLSGFMFTGLMCLYLATINRHSREVGVAVRHKTRELSEANEKLEQLSLTDGLTGVMNRRGFDQTIRREWARAMRNSSPLTLLIVDVDFFKNYNDHYGHLEGDTCLKHVAAALADIPARESDVLARYGGEEFAFLLPDTDDSEAVIAQRCCTMIEALALKHENSVTAKVVTVSAGSATMWPSMDNLLDELITKADEALYMAKDQGRNRAVKL